MYDNKWEYLDKFLKINKLNGMELLLHGNYNIEKITKNTVKGLHLSYFPTWLEFYNDNKKYKEDFPKKEDLLDAFLGETKDSILLKFKKEFKIAKQLEVSYMVFHLSHVRLKDAFLFEYEYSNIDVINAVIDIVNKVFVGNSGITLLFENLWWQVLRYYLKVNWII